MTLTNWRALFAPPSATEEEVAELRELVDEAVATPEWAATVERNYWREAPLQVKSSISTSPMRPNASPACLRRLNSEHPDQPLGASAR